MDFSTDSYILSLFQVGDSSAQPDQQQAGQQGCREEGGQEGRRQERGGEEGGSHSGREEELTRGGNVISYFLYPILQGGPKKMPHFIRKKTLGTSPR